jgi:hypothetical protein
LNADWLTAVVHQNMTNTYLYCSNYVGNQFIIAIRHSEEYTTSETGFINKCIEDIVPAVTVQTFPNQKPWITANIRTVLKGRAAAFKVRD